MQLTRFFLVFSAVLACTLAGCMTPQNRARQNAAGFQKLSASDQRLVLQGRVRRGMNEEAVYIAWGTPDAKKAGGDKAPTETWIYQRQIAIEAPFGSYDQWPAGNNPWGTSAPLAFHAGYGFGGIGSEGWLLYQPHLRVVDATVKRAEFVNGKLERYDMRNGSFTIAP